MTAQQGFKYEENAAELLKQYNLVPSGFKPAGAGHDEPDLLLIYRKIKAGCELKITAALYVKERKVARSNKKKGIAEAHGWGSAQQCC